MWLIKKLKIEYFFKSKSIKMVELEQSVDDVIRSLSSGTGTCASCSTKMVTIPLNRVSTIKECSECNAKVCPDCIHKCEHCDTNWCKNHCCQHIICPPVDTSTMKGKLLTHNQIMIISILKPTWFHWIEPVITCDLRRPNTYSSPSMLSHLEWDTKKKVVYAVYNELKGHEDHRGKEEEWRYMWKEEISMQRTRSGQLGLQGLQKRSASLYHHPVDGQTWSQRKSLGSDIPECMRNGFTTSPLVSRWILQAAYIVKSAVNNIFKDDEKALRVKVKNIIKIWLNTGTLGLMNTLKEEKINAKNKYEHVKRVKAEYEASCSLCKMIKMVISLEHGGKEGAGTWSCCGRKPGFGDTELFHLLESMGKSLYGSDKDAPCCTCTILANFILDIQRTSKPQKMSCLI